MWPPKTPWFLEKAEAGVALMSLSVTEGSVRAISVLNAWLPADVMYLFVILREFLPDSSDIFAKYVQHFRQFIIRQSFYPFVIRIV